jgi:hypothetical protein
MAGVLQYNIDDELGQEASYKRIRGSGVLNNKEGAESNILDA